MTWTPASTASRAACWLRLPVPHAATRRYVLNLIDTPGHVDFGYEVSRSLAACEGALLVVDASQGVEAQTIANVYLALENDLEIVPVLNKIDLPGADLDNTAEEVESTIGLDCTDAIPASAKVGLGVPEILEVCIDMDMDMCTRTCCTCGCMCMSARGLQGACVCVRVCACVCMCRQSSSASRRPSRPSSGHCAL